MGRRPRRQLWLVIIGFGLLGIAVLLTAGLVVQHPDQSRYASIEAQVTSKSCYQASDGGDAGRTFTACNISVLYTAPDGTPGAVQLPGIDADRIRRHGGHESPLIYFANRSSGTPISPQDIVPRQLRRRGS